jgi:hypothetical protein
MEGWDVNPDMPGKEFRFPIPILSELVKMILTVDSHVNYICTCCSASEHASCCNACGVVGVDVNGKIGVSLPY